MSRNIPICCDFRAPPTSHHFLFLRNFSFTIRSSTELDTHPRHCSCPVFAYQVMFIRQPFLFVAGFSIKFLVRDKSRNVLSKLLCNVKAKLDPPHYVPLQEIEKRTPAQESDWNWQARVNCELWVPLHEPMWPRFILSQST